MATKKKKPATEGMSKQERINSIVSSTNASYGKSVVVRASEANTSYLLRRPTGFTDIDIALGGGFVAGALNIIVGPESVGKNYLLNCILARQQQIHGDDFAAVVYTNEFKFDKGFARNCGLRVAMTEEEAKEYENARVALGHAPLSDAEREELFNQVGELVLLEDVLVDDALDIVLDLVEENCFQIIGIDSFGNLETAAKDSVDSLSDSPQQSNEAVLVSRWLPKLFMRMNRVSKNQRNETAIVALNQVRAKRNVVSMPGRPVAKKSQYQSALRAHAMKHGKAIELALHEGSKLYEPKSKEFYGKETMWEIAKGKLGTHEGPKGTLQFIFGEGVDQCRNTVLAAIDNDVFTKSHAWYYATFGDQEIRAQGVDNLVEKVRELGLEPDVRMAAMQASGVVFRYE